MIRSSRSTSSSRKRRSSSFAASADSRKAPCGAPFFLCVRIALTGKKVAGRSRQSRRPRVAAGPADPTAPRRCGGPEQVHGVSRKTLNPIGGLNVQLSARNGANPACGKQLVNSNVHNCTKMEQALSPSRKALILYRLTPSLKVGDNCAQSSCERNGQTGQVASR